MHRFLQVVKNIFQSGSISDGMRNSGGVMAKMSQLKDAGNLESASWDRVLSPEPALTCQRLRDHVAGEVVWLDLCPWKSGSIGQVHRGQLTTGESVCFKVRHCGVEQKITEDLGMIHTAARFVRGLGVRIGQFEEECESMFWQEVDFSLEARYQEQFRHIWTSVEWVQIPKIVPRLSSNSVMCSEHLSGTPFQDFVRISDQAAINKVCYQMVYFVLKSYMKHGLFYTDIHPGNFLVTDRADLIVVDFGAIKVFTKTQVDCIIMLYKSILQKDASATRQALEACGLLPSGGTGRADALVRFFEIQLEPFTSSGEYEFTAGFFTRSTTVRVSDMISWELPSYLIWFGRILINMNQLLIKCKAKAQFSQIFIDCLD